MRLIPEADLPTELDPFAAVRAAYPAILAKVESALARKLSVLIECDKELSPYFYKCVRDRLKAREIPAVYLDGRPPPDWPDSAPRGMVAVLISTIRDAVRAAVSDRVVVLPHLDLLTAGGQIGLTTEAREAISLLYENPNIVWLGFKDPSFILPQVLENLFPIRESVLGIDRSRLGHLVLAREARKLGRDLDPYRLYKYVSGVNAVRLRRLMSSLEGEDYPTDPEPVYAQLRSATIGAELSLPNLDLERDIGGYAKVKRRLRSEILDIIAAADRAARAEDGIDAVRRLEQLIPKGMIFWGPPGTGKTLFAKAMASALGAAVTVVSGPELKSKWVGESEERLRQVFVRARQSAPAVIVFDELDSFATARGTYTGSGVEHSMVNQLLTEMDGFRSDELVFVVGTTNFVESLDPALLRPGRFEFHLEIPYPGADDRRAIFEIYDARLDLRLSERALSYAVKRTADPTSGGGRYSGDHIQALCRAIARRRLRERLDGPTEIDDVETVITQYLDRPELTSSEEVIVAAHEAGHAVVALFCEHAPPIERISIQGDIGGALGFVRYSDPAHRYVVSEAQLHDAICTLFGGREAEALLCGGLSIGSADDLDRATELARALVEDYVMGGHEVGARRLSARAHSGEPAALSEVTRGAADAAIRDLLERERARARRLLDENRAALVALRDLLLEEKVLDSERLGRLLEGRDG